MKRDWTSAGKQISRLRQQKGLSQQSLATISGLHLRTVQRSEAGKCNAETMVCLAAALEADVEELLRATHPPPEIVAMDIDTSEAQSGLVTGLVLATVETGKSIMDLLDASVAVRLDFDHVAGVEAESVGAFLQAIQGWSALVHELTPVERVRASTQLHDQLSQLHRHGLRVIGGIQSRPLNVAAHRNVMRPVAVVIVRTARKSEESKQKRRAS